MHLDHRLGARRGWRLAALVASAAALLPASAEAGIYDVHTCRLPSGAPAPVEGWTSSTSGAWVGAVQNCGVGGALEARLDSNQPHNNGDHAAWTWTAPANVTIVGFNGGRAVVAGPDQAYGSPGYSLYTSPGGPVESCLRFQGCNSLGDMGSPGAGANGVAGLASANSVTAIVQCAGGGTCVAGDTRLRIYRMLFNLADNHDPIPAGASGQLAQPGTHSGTESVSFSATDQGSGLYRALVLVDGHQVYNQILDSNGGACQDAVAGGSPYEFKSPVPCKLSKSAQIAFDTRTITDHQHTLEVRVEDASGNTATVFGPNTINVDNIPAPSNSSAPTQGGTTKMGHSLTAGFGSWDDHGVAGDPVFAVQWVRCLPNGGACSPIDGATDQVYPLGEGDLGYEMRALVTATNSEGTSQAQSARSAVVTTESGTVPACADGIDNDNDGKADDADDDCDSRGDTDEATPPAADPCAGQPAGSNDPCGDYDGDGTRNNADTDDDNDGVLDVHDPSPLNAAVPSRNTTTTSSHTGSSSSSFGTTTTTSTTSVTTAGGPVNGSGGSAFSGRFDASSRRSISMRFNQTKTVTGKLVDATGKPIADASVDVLEQIRRPGAPFNRLGTVVTNRDGVYAYRLPAGPSRTLRFAFASRLGDSEYRDTADVLVRVQAVLVVSAAKRTVRHGKSMSLKGRLLGAKYLPKRGAILEVQARDGRRWRTIAVKPATQGGRVAYRYRFRVARNASFLFRVRLRPGANVPLEATTSKQIRVNVR